MTLEDMPKQRAYPFRHLPHRADKQDLFGRPSADQRLAPTRRRISMFESQAFKALNLNAPQFFPLGQRAFRVLGWRGPFQRPQQWTIENKS
jgi:hypothetical protein